MKEGLHILQGVGRTSKVVRLVIGARAQVFAELITLIGNMTAKIAHMDADCWKRNAILIQPHAGTGRMPTS